ncbi:MAG TPA: hypothetical protein VFU36_13325 [Jatrophihabitans sp.]|nr:hypothetical protein [Jatrophihabitans sp.]
MSALTGIGAEVVIDGAAGYRIAAPGLTGAARATTEPVVPGTATGQVFMRALGNAGLSPSGTILLAHSSAAGGDVRVTVPAPAAGNNALLLVHDSTGAVSWHLPDRAAGAAQPDRQAMSFTVAANRFTHDPGGLLSRAAGLVEHFGSHFGIEPGHFGVGQGHFGIDTGHFGIGQGPAGARKVLSVLEYPVGHLAGWQLSNWFAAWERNKHPAVIRWFPPAPDHQLGEPLSPTNWGNLAQGRVLLFIHGIFSTCNGAFGAIGSDGRTWPALRQAYGGRIIGYDHPTASVGPEQNAAAFLRQIPDGLSLDVDIVTHSRGGLVARALAAQGSAKLRIGKIVFAATPNGGSQITMSRNWITFINRISSVLTLPALTLPAPVEGITEVLAGVLELVKVLGVGTMDQLPGLDAMRPDSTFLSRLARGNGSTAEYYAAAAEFQPGPMLAHLFNRLDDLAHVVDDAVFPHVRNDIAVPTNGVWDPADPAGLATPAGAPVLRGLPVPGFPVPDERRLLVGRGSTYWHCTYFQDQAMRDALVRWLTPAAA